MGISDAARWALAFAFLIIVPAIYFSCIQLFIVTYPTVLSTGRFPPTAGDIGKIALLTLLTVPNLGFYNIWQAIVRSYPAKFYSPMAMKKIALQYRNAFDVRPAETCFTAIAYIAVPLLLLAIVWA